MGIEGIAPKATHSSRAFGNAATAILPPATAAVPTPRYPQNCHPLGLEHVSVTSLWTCLSSPWCACGCSSRAPQKAQHSHVPPSALTQSRDRARCRCAGECGCEQGRRCEWGQCREQGNATCPPREPMAPLLPAVLGWGWEAAALTWSWPGRRWRSGGSCLAAWPPWAALWR